MKFSGSNYLVEWVTLPDVPALKQRLEKKLVEYQQRIEKYKRDYAVTSVGIVVDRDGNLMDSIYKEAIVKALLVDGKVNIGKLRKQMKRDFKGYLLDDMFTNAVSVVDDYLRTGGAHTTGVSKFFNNELFESILNKSGSIELPKDINIRQRLRKKYHEYLGRILDYERYSDKTLDGGGNKRDHYKSRIIALLQKDSRVDLHKLIKELIDAEGNGFDRLEFYRASARIHELLDSNYFENDTTLS